RRSPQSPRPRTEGQPARRPASSARSRTRASVAAPGGVRPRARPRAGLLRRLRAIAALRQREDELEVELRALVLRREVDRAAKQACRLPQAGRAPRLQALLQDEDAEEVRGPRARARGRVAADQAVEDLLRLPLRAPARALALRAAPGCDRVESVPE